MVNSIYLAGNFSYCSFCKLKFFLDKFVKFDVSLYLKLNKVSFFHRIKRFFFKFRVNLVITFKKGVNNID